MLKNHIEDKLKMPPPSYSFTKVSEQVFQCSVSHGLFGTVSGNQCKGKQNAKQSAARQAVIQLELYT